MNIKPCRLTMFNWYLQYRSEQQKMNKEFNIIRFRYHLKKNLMSKKVKVAFAVNISGVTIISKLSHDVHICKHQSTKLSCVLFVSLNCE